MPAIIFNGEARTVESSMLSALLGELGLGEKKFAVEINREIVPKSEHSTTPLKEGDVIEVVQFVGGG